MSNRVVLLFNPVSGRGKAERFARALTGALSSDGWEVDPVNVTQIDASAGLNGARAVVLVGGDGTAHRAALAIARAQVPFVIAPTGTENLLAKELGMTADIEQICRVLRGGGTGLIDLPTVNDVPFLVMCSVGLDAAIVAQVGSNRRGTIRKSIYLKPVLRQTLHPSIPKFRVVVDGRTVVDEQRGMLVVANCPRYGARLDPAPNASMTDGQLDVAFYPLRHSLDAVRWAMLSRIGKHETAPGFIKARGRGIEVHCSDEAEAPVQIDGEPAPEGMAIPLKFVADAGQIACLQQSSRFP
jgi:diacylglycerol kinase (ATP)